MVGSVARRVDSAQRQAFAEREALAADELMVRHEGQILPLGMVRAAAIDRRSGDVLQQDSRR